MTGDTVDTGWSQNRAHKQLSEKNIIKKDFQALSRQSE